MNKYFDYSSTTEVASEILESYQEVLKKYYVNSESLYPRGAEVNHLMEKSREKIASLLKVLPKEIIFTSSGSEANNLAIKGTALKRSHLGKHIITTVVEHSSVFHSCQWLEKYLGFEVTYLPVDQSGVISLEDLTHALRQDTILVSIMYINNESGAIMPIDEIKKIIRKYPNCYFHVDCVQALGKIKVDFTDIDLASISAHKLNGLKGSGLLMKKQHVQLAELISAGQQEFGLRGGTANAPVNMVLAKTIRLALQRFELGYTKVVELHDYLYQQLEKIPNIVLNSSSNGTPFIINFSCLTVTSQVMMNALALDGFEVSAQSTCDSSLAKSRVISQMFKDENRLKGTIRISLSYQHNKQDVDALLAAIKESIKKYG